ncbi:MAG: hypothetical protein WA484_04800 [Solirubrobacteraceae bacterium]
MSPGAARSSGFVHHWFVHYSNRERILDAVAQLTAADGYTALTAQSIAERADISQNEPSSPTSRTRTRRSPPRLRSAT